MEIQIQEVNDIIGDLNSEFYEQGVINCCPLEVCSVGWQIIIKFAGDVVWNSEDDMRDTADEDTDAYEPLERFLRRGINDCIEQLSKVRL